MKAIDEAWEKYSTTEFIFEREVKIMDKSDFEKAVKELLNKFGKYFQEVDLFDAYTEYYVDKFLMRS